jgi:hypothetical protein
MSKFLYDETMRVLQAHRGRQNAMPRRDLWARLTLFNPRLSDRDLREIYSRLPVCSCPEGLFIPATADEVREFKEYIRKSWGPIVAHRRVATIVAYYPKLDPTVWKQQELGL